MLGATIANYSNDHIQFYVMASYLLSYKATENQMSVTMDQRKYIVRTYNLMSRARLYYVYGR